MLACLALAALSLLCPSTPTYDPWAWIIWGREVMHLDLVTTERPVVEAAADPVHRAVLAGRRRAGARAVDLVARAGGLLAIAMAYRLGGAARGRPRRA